MAPKETFSRELARWAGFNLVNCIGVDECMKACPVVDPSLSIAELNEATREGAPLTGAVLKFASDCVQCGRCDTVCPTAAGRSLMMLSLKEKMAQTGAAPATHRKYFALKGYDKSATRRTAFNMFMKARWRLDKVERLKSEKLAPHIDKEDLRSAEYLLYFGCYIFTKETSAAMTVDIADRLGMDYEVLGGLKSCCGWPSLLAGRTGEAEDYHGYLADVIQRAEPKYAVTGCAECFMSLRKIKDKYSMSFEPLTIPMWLNMFSEKLNLRRDEVPMTFHDSCHISRKANTPEPARELLSKMAPVTEMRRSGPKDTFCCGYWGLGGDEAKLKAMHLSRFDEAKGTGAGAMVVECVTCLESFSKSASGSGIRTRDIVELVHERMGI